MLRGRVDIIQRFDCSMEYNIDNVNITDRVVYFVLQMLTSKLVTPGTGLHYMWRVLRRPTITAKQ